jgi:hypothetical protein
MSTIDHTATEKRDGYAIAPISAREGMGRRAGDIVIQQ